MKTLFTAIVLVSMFLQIGYSQDVLVEAESFDHKGGWLVDPQFVEQMGSPYLLAHGLGEPVANASTEIEIPENGNYTVWVRSKNWVPGDWEAPGRFVIMVNGKETRKELGTVEGWNWEKAGEVSLRAGRAKLELKDLTGFDGRCDAIFLTTGNAIPPSGMDELKKWRRKMADQSAVPATEKNFDLVVIGGGIAGCAAAIAAAEQGLEVALIHDRPVLGGNASSEIRVHTLGIYGYFERILKKIDTEHYPNGSPKALEADEKRMENVRSYPNIHLFMNYRAYDAITEDNRIVSVDAKETSSGDRFRFNAPLFADCTGDGWIGYWSGAEYMYGRESKSAYDEGWESFGDLWSPVDPDDKVMGASVLWRSYNAGAKYNFPEVPWALSVAGNYSAANGEWMWEFSRNDLSQVYNAETIRDHMLRAIYGSFYNQKQKCGTENLKLEWVSYLVGKRESRRLKGDYIFTFQDVRQHRNFDDAVVMEKRDIDVHFQDRIVDRGKPDFLSTALYYNTEQYYVPYRCLYSVNITNLFMAGRCFSCSHIGLGGPRVMRTTGQMGAAAGFAAAVCHEHSATPRDVYSRYLDEYMALIKNQQ
ncbi:MAG TPA: FAD-dependent oxidoreductase [Bacteroidales bacterium]|nr:FAD-dependent oxidoreductase [Bacteroidales bacterium]